MRISVCCIFGYAHCTIFHLFPTVKFRVHRLEKIRENAWGQKSFFSFRVLSKSLNNRHLWFLEQFLFPSKICFCSPTGLLPEVPLLQAFENEVGRGWTRLIIAVLTIISLCFSLLELSLPLHRMVRYHLIFISFYYPRHPRWLATCTRYKTIYKAGLKTR